jgi:hypothetical protein
MSRQAHINIDFFYKLVILLDANLESRQKAETDVDMKWNMLNCEGRKP